MDRNLDSVLTGREDPRCPAPGNSYAQWVRTAIRQVGRSGGRAISLFDSSVPEPTVLLRGKITSAFSEPLTSRYTSAFTGGNPFVVSALAARYGVPSEQILCTTGATGALGLLYRALTRPGDHVLVETPGFDLFHEIAAAQGLHVDYVERTGARFVVDAERIAALLHPRTRLVVLSNLHNPSGMAIDQSALDALVILAEQRGFLVVIDEVYGDYADTGARPGPAAHLSPNFISVSSLTKIYGLSTLRCGWIIAAPGTLAPVRLASEQSDFAISNLAHAVAALVLEDSAPFDAYWRAIIAETRPIIADYFARWCDDGLIEGLLPDYGCISFPRLVGIADSCAFSEWLADRSGVIVAPGGYFGAPDHIRIGHAQHRADLEEGLAALDEGLRAYPGRP